MKKKILLFIIMFLIMPISVLADSIYSIDMKIDITKEGTANVVETWDVKADNGTEWYKTMYELNNSELTNYKVQMDGKELKYQENWNNLGTLSEKVGYYGINNTDKGIELCFGKGDYERHQFTVSYTLSNYVFNTSDSQVLAWVIFPKVNADYFSAEITSYYQFPDTLDVWGYGYKGYAYVKDGKIMISSEGSLSNEFVSVLVKFPLDTFTTTNVDSRYNSFNDVYKVAEEGTFKYDYGDAVYTDSIYSIDMKIDITKEGTANVVEIWDVKANNGTTWYKPMYELNNSELTNYKVLMDGKELKYQEEWDASGSLSEKKGYYGIIKTYEGIELRFGKGDFKRHKFTVSYTLSNYVFNTSDSQVLAWVIFPKGVAADYVSAEITSYYQFPDTLDVLGYGYGVKENAYVKDGKIKISRERKFIDKYVSVLVKFPLDTFTTTNVDSRYNSFNDVYKVAKKEIIRFDDILIYIFVVILLLLGFVFTLIVGSNISAMSNIYIRYGYKDNKVINKYDTPLFREIPCNKDIYYANALIKLNDFDYKGSNIFGAIILKWVKENKIGFATEKKGIFKKKYNSVIDLTRKPTFDNDSERKLFDIMYKASRNGLLETKELERWCKRHYSKFLNLFKEFENNKINELIESGHIYIRNNKQECECRNVMDDSIYEDSKKLYGLKLYLNEFSRMDTKEVMEVHLWDEYLMFAYLFGIADKVANQLKHMYPEVKERMQQFGFDFDTIIFVNNILIGSVLAAKMASERSVERTERFLDFFDGFSSGGGGGYDGGFSGGGGGSAGGR